MQQAKQLNDAQEIRIAFNWLFNTITPQGAVATPSMLEIQFYQKRVGATTKDNPHGNEATAFCGSGAMYLNQLFLQPLPPIFKPQKLSYKVYFFIDEWLFFEVKDVDFLEQFEGENILEQKTEDDGMLFVSVQNLFKVAIKSMGGFTIPATDFKMVQKGKSSYKVFDKGAGGYEVVRADNHALIKENTPTYHGVIKLYKELV